MNCHSREGGRTRFTVEIRFHQSFASSAKCNLATVNKLIPQMIVIPAQAVVLVFRQTSESLIFCKGFIDLRINFAPDSQRPHRGDAASLAPLPLCTGAAGSKFIHRSVRAVQRIERIDFPDSRLRGNDEVICLLFLRNSKVIALSC